jgi:hypothetical protein
MNNYPALLQEVKDRIRRAQIRFPRPAGQQSVVSKCCHNLGEISGLL